MRSPVEKKFGSLKTYTLAGAPGGPAVILFHGYGADASDLLPLAEMMGLGPQVTWIFPEAPLQVIIAPGMTGKAWFNIDQKRLEQGLMSGEPADMSQSQPPGLEAARKAAASLYDEVLKSHTQVVLGGFSQGAMLATELTMTHAKKPAGLVLMSGSLICADRWATLAPSAAGLSFLQTHGKNDALLGHDHAERLHELLNTAGLDGEFLSFNGGHEIPPKVISKVGSYIGSVLTSRRR